jgi:formiminoglutamase
VTERRPAVAIVHIPMRLGSISGGRFDLAPRAIDDAAFGYVARGRHEEARILRFGATIEDHGDADVVERRPEDAFRAIANMVGGAFGDELDRVRPDRAVAVLGGDNSTTRPGVHGIAFDVGIARVGLLTLDAHHDIRPTLAGLSNGNPVRALLEDGLPGANVVQVGIQPFANMPEHAEFAREAGIRAVTADEVRSRGIEPVVTEAPDALAARADAVYVDLDVDVLDRAFAPACPGARPGGLTPVELQAAARLCGAHPRVRAMDLVEVDPERDVANITVLAAASFLMAFAEGLATRGTL